MELLEVIELGNGKSSYFIIISDSKVMVVLILASFETSHPDASKFLASPRSVTAAHPYFNPDSCISVGKDSKDRKDGCSLKFPRYTI